MDNEYNLDHIGVARGAQVGDSGLVKARGMGGCFLKPTEYIRVRAANMIWIHLYSLRESR